MIRKKVTFEIEGGEIRLYKISSQEKVELEAFLQDCPIEVYILKELLALRERIDKEFSPQWTHKYEYNLDTAQTNKLIDQFPTPPKYLYVKEATGTVTLNFNSQNEPSWTLTVKDQFRMPFEAIYLTWTAQATKKLIFYVSNQEIKRSTLT